MLELRETDRTAMGRIQDKNRKRGKQKRRHGRPWPGKILLQSNNDGPCRLNRHISKIQEILNFYLSFAILTILSIMPG